MLNTMLGEHIMVELVSDNTGFDGTLISVSEEALLIRWTYHDGSIAEWLVPLSQVRFIKCDRQAKA